MPYVFHKDRVNEKVYGLDGGYLHFNKKGWAQTDDAELAAHFGSVDGYNVHDELPEDGVGDLQASGNRADAAKIVINEPEDNGGAVVGGEVSEFVAGKTRGELEGMTKADLVDFANDLGVVFESPRMTNAQMIEAILASGN
jgi:hypothetical protein